MDFDPEEDAPEYDASSASEPEEDRANGFDGREHYETVGKSKLRGKQLATLGPQYAGSKVQRKNVEDSDEEHDPFAEFGSDEGSDEVEELDEDAESSSDAQSSNDEDDDNDEAMEDMRSDSSDPQDSHPIDFNTPAIQNRAQTKSDTAQLKHILAAQNKSVATTLATSQRADAQKGAAVKQQRQAFDSLLNSRIRLQNGLVALNTLPTISESDQDPSKSVHAAATSAESAARTLWSSLDSLRCALATAKTGQKRKRPAPTASLPDLWTHMTSLDADATPQRRATLAKWSEKTQSGATKAAKSSTSKLYGHKGGETTLLDVLDTQLADPERLVRKSRVPRSGAPVQAREYAAARRAHLHDTVDGDTTNSNGTGGIAADIFDDADFYSALLKELLTQRQATHQTPAQPTSTTSAAAPPDLESEYRAAASKSAAAKKVVDTRASKGRKMRYTVHEKLLNFMVPEVRGAWGERQAGELFAGLFGGRGGRGPVDGDDQREREGEDGVEGALRLFRGV